MSADGNIYYTAGNDRKNYYKKDIFVTQVEMTMLDINLFTLIFFPVVGKKC